MVNGSLGRSFLFSLGQLALNFKTKIDSVSWRFLPYIITRTIRSFKPRPDLTPVYLLPSIKLPSLKYVGLQVHKWYTLKKKLHIKNWLKPKSWFFHSHSFSNCVYLEFFLDLASSVYVFSPESSAEVRWVGVVSEC